MNKKELIKEVWSSELLTKDVTIETLNEVITATFAVIKKEIDDGQKVMLKGFGTFYAKPTAQKKGRNPSTGNAIIIPASIKPSFKASKNFKESIKKTI